MPDVLSAARAVAALAVAMLLWEAAVRGLHISPFYLPALSVVLTDLWSASGLYGTALLRTLTETLLGFLAGTAFGFLCGVVFAHVRLAERMFFPFFVASQTVPVIAFGALVIIWFGNGILSKVVIAFYLTFFPVTVNTLRGLLAVDDQQVALLRSFGARKIGLLLKLRLPSALPMIFVACRLGISLGLVGAIVGEWFGDNVGLGVMLMQAMYAEQMARLWAIILVCGALGATLYGLLTLIERRFVWWGAG